MINKEEFIKRAKEIHGNKYDYSKVNYTKVTDKVCIICPEHGEFWQEARQHYRGQGCPKCGVNCRTEKKRDTNESFIKKARKVHGNKYDYSKVNYIDTKTKVCIICPEHGEFYLKPGSHINNKNGCPKCGKIKLSNSLKLTTEEFIKRAKEIHGNKYDYSKVKYNSQKDKVCIICPEHGEFWQNPYTHYNGQGCPKCGIIKRSKTQSKSTEKFIKQAIEVHGNKYDYSKTNYINSHHLVSIICPEHGEFWQNPTYHLSGCGCQKCGMITSHYEDSLFDYIKSIYKGKIIRDNRTILSNLKQSLDIYIPDLKIAFEFDGLYWHNELNKPDKNYHLKKTEECFKKGIQLIHIFEDEWLYKQDIVKSRIKNLLGLITDKIYARKCIIKEITNKESKTFCENNHIQGGINSKYSFGLFFNNELVSVMTFGDKRKNLGSKSITDNYELLRFCNKLNTSVIGGASKLLKYFIKTYNPQEIISYADRRWSIGKLYETLNFKFSHESQPNYFYVFGDKKKNRFNFRKNILIEKYNCPENMTEHEFCLSQKWYRIYDCGTLVYVWKQKSQ